MSASRKAKAVPSDPARRSVVANSADILAVVTAEGRMMTREERVAFIDDIRSRSKATDLDSTDLIRRDRDER